MEFLNLGPSEAGQLGWLEPRDIGTSPAHPAAAGPKFAVIIITPTIKSSKYCL